MGAGPGAARPALSRGPGARGGPEIPQPLLTGVPLPTPLSVPPGSLQPRPRPALPPPPPHHSPSVAPGGQPSVLPAIWPPLVHHPELQTLPRASGWLLWGARPPARTPALPSPGPAPRLTSPPAPRSQTCRAGRQVFPLSTPAHHGQDHAALSLVPKDSKAGTGSQQLIWVLTEREPCVHRSQPLCPPCKSPARCLVLGLGDSDASTKNLFFCVAQSDVCSVDRSDPSRCPSSLEGPKGASLSAWTQGETSSRPCCLRMGSWRVLCPVPCGCSA